MRRHPLGGRGAVFALDEASLLHMPGVPGPAGPYQDSDAILRLLARMAELTDTTLQYGRVLAGAAPIVACVITGRHAGKRLDAEVACIIAAGEGKIGEVWVFHPDQAHVDDFWS